MACDITLGRLEPCKSAVGGLKAVYFVNWGDATGYTYNGTNTDVIDTVTGTPSAYKYELKGTNSFDQTITSSRENGTTFFDQSLKLQLKSLDVVTHKQIKLLAYGRPQVIVEDNNGNFFYCGLEHGMDVTGGTIVTGTAMGDLSGYTLELKGMERVPANFLGDTLADVGFTVVSGT
jgi:subtilisin family serine protease